MDEQEFYELLSSEIRREILRSVAREPKYLFQLAKELNKSQQLLARHLSILCEKDWLTTEEQESHKGPQRKLYAISKNVSVRITLSKHEFSFSTIDIRLGEASISAESGRDGKILSGDLLDVIDKTTEEVNLENVTERSDILKNLDQLLGSVENVILKKKLEITGELKSEIQAMQGDDLRKDREVAYTIFSSTVPLKIDLIQKEVKGKRSELIASLKRLLEKNLLPEPLVEELEELEDNIQTNVR